MLVKGNVTINGNVNIYYPGDEEDRVKKAKDKLINLLWNKRNSPAWGGKKHWEKMLDLYMMHKYNEMFLEILGMSENKQEKTKEKALSYLMTIINADDYWYV